MRWCKYCKSTENLTLDHKIPLAIGGKNEQKNLQCLCGRCNQQKSDLSERKVRRIWRWLIRIQCERIMRGKNPYMTKIMEEYGIEMVVKSYQDGKIDTRQTTHLFAKCLCGS